MSVKESFLAQVAADLLQKYGNDLSQVTVVFPNRRARLFFNDYLCKVTDKPIWAPVYASLDELFRIGSTLQSADSLKLLTELYYTYTSVYHLSLGTPSIETFDEFYFFGEILLNDFNDIDKNLVNERALFSNLSELDKLKDDFEHLDEKQWFAIERFFKDISTNRTQLKEAFFSIWTILGTVYAEFKQKLVSENITYDGMLFRSVIENLRANGTDVYSQKKYAFVGFNVLTECEKALFKQLKLDDKALFYWDYDTYYMNETQEAGRFMRENIRLFGSDLPNNSFDSFAAMLKKITIVASPSESAQAGYIEGWLKEIRYPQNGDAPDTAIVLCNEANLQSVMHALPQVSPFNGEALTANLTMGFPLAQTPVYSFLMALSDLQLKGLDASNNRFRYRYVLPVLRHPYMHLLFLRVGEVLKNMVKQNNFFPLQSELEYTPIFRAIIETKDLVGYMLEHISAVAQVIRQQQAERNEFSDLYHEALFRAYQVVNRLHDLLQKGDLQVERATFASLLKRLLGSTSVPFHGEPARGLQVMGVLETRNMDFTNVLLMSVNEGVMPKSENESSFIPHFIRRFFGMTTIEHQDSLYAYYFYRLLQRAENIVLCYNTANQQTGKSEMSRFLLQLLTEYPHLEQIVRVSLQSDIQPAEALPLAVPKTPALIDKIKDKYNQQSVEPRTLSPSALNNYLDCSLRFYLKYIEGIKPPQEISDELDNSVLGSVFHKTAELIYREIGHLRKEQKEFPPFVVTKEQIESFVKIESRLEKAIEKAFDETFFQREMPRSRYNGEQLIYFSIVKQYMLRLLKLDMEMAPFSIVSLEQAKYRAIEVEGIQLKIGGIVDRIDEKDGVLRIVDYKTGGSPKTAESMDNLFVPAKNRANYIFQAFLYASILVKEQPEKVQAALVYIQKAIEEDYSPLINWQKQPINDFRDLTDEFDEALQEKLKELFNPDIPFTQTIVEDNCKYCDFKGMCVR